MKNLLLIFLCFTCAFCYGQDEVTNNKYTTAISFIPSALLQPDHTFLPGAERFVRKQISIAMDAGLIFASESFRSSQDPKRNGAFGFILRPSVKLYTSAKQRFYFQPQFFYKQFTVKKYDWLGMNCVNEVPAYEQLRDFKLRRMVNGYNLCVGYVTPFSKGRFFIDFYGGLGVRYRNTKVVDVANACYDRPQSAIDLGINGEGSAVSLPGGIRLFLKLEN